MSSRPEPTPFWYPHYWPTWLGIGLLRLVALLPYTWMMRIGRVLGRLGRRLAGRRNHYVETNLRLCFPDMAEAARDALATRHFEAVGMAIMDFAIAWWWSDRRLYRLVEIEGRENIESAMSRGKGVIFLTAHFTSIEISGRLLADICPALPMYRPSNNPLLENIMIANRQRHVERTIPRSDVRLMLRTLQQGKGVWFAPDQNFGAKGGVFAPFFGIPASSNTSLSRFAEMTGAAVVPFVVFRRPAGGYRMVVEPALSAFPSGDATADAAMYNAITERWVRHAPEQYNWLHRRFKKRPAGEAPLY
jgi:KDO2-lipid IV(A) lauroyltransferase